MRHKEETEEVRAVILPMKKAKKGGGLVEEPLWRRDTCGSTRGTEGSEELKKGKEAPMGKPLFFLFYKTQLTSQLQQALRQP